VASESAGKSKMEMDYKEIKNTIFKIIFSKIYLINKTSPVLA